MLPAVTLMIYYAPYLAALFFAVASKLPVSSRQVNAALFFLARTGYA
jgi:hypothetical protein